MPIISFSINEHLKKFLNKLITTRIYPNQSKVMRDALLRLESSIDTTVASEEIVSYDTPKVIIGNAMIIVENGNDSTNKKLLKLEMDFKESIVGKSQFLYTNLKTILFVFEGKIRKFQDFITEINGIENLKNFRYVIIN